LGQTADVVVIAPATADLLARATHGLANDLLTNVLLTARCPIVMAPAMHTEMWVHPATQRNVAELRSRGVIVLEPASGRLTGSDTGPGRLPDPSAIVAAVQDVLRRTPSNDLAGLKILISAGGTQEAWDPVRFIGNRSSGRQGVELARTAVSRGAHVTLVAAHMDVEPPAGVTVVKVESADDLHQAMHGQSADVIVMAAAVADFRPDLEAARKIKKDSLTGDLHLTLTTTVDVLASLVEQRTGRTPLIIGFAAETADSPEHLLELGRSKLKRKGCDLLVVNEVGSEVVFGSDENKVTILGADGSCRSMERTSKAVVADALWDLVATQL
jgi:phosphopantothenoylcysteine decarboxylase/phosphopantothenate--cysteine ligase